MSGMMEVGVVSHNDEYISDQCMSCYGRELEYGADKNIVYTTLRAAWGNYKVVWWNSYDFTIRLAYLLHYSSPAKEKLILVRRKFDTWRAKLIMFEESNAAGKACLMGGACYFGSTLLLLVAPVVFPVIAFRIMDF
jgi:hypothetical protein